MKLLKTLKITSLYDNLHFLLILLILVILSISYWYIIPILIIYLVFLFRKTVLFSLGVIFSILILLSSTKYFFKFDKTTFEGIVVECDSKKALISSEGSRVLVYHNDVLTLGDYGKFNVSEIDYDTELFNYSEYLMNKGIMNYYKLDNFELSNNYFVIAKVQAYFMSFVDQNPSGYSSYIKTLFFAYKTDLTIEEAASNLGISHLLAVSGMHISILVLLLEFIIKKFFYYTTVVDVILSILLLFYLVLTNFELTVLRAVLMTLLKKIFEHKRWIFTSLDNLSIVGIIILLLNPRGLFLLSFQLSFLVSFIIIIFAKNFEFKSKLIAIYFISFVAFLVTFPFVINTNYEVNLLAIIIGPLYVIYFELLLYPATLIMLFVPQTYLILDYVFHFFEMTLFTLDGIKCFTFIFGKLSTISFVLYEVVLYFLLVSFEIKRGRIILSLTMIIFLIFVYNKAFFNPFYKVKMYDVGQGDSILITMPFNQGNILIDCYNDIGSHLKKDGVKNIDVIFLSHGHKDHIDAYEDIAKEYQIKQTYSSYYDSTSLLKELRNEYEIILLKSGDKVLYKELIFYVLGPIKSYKKENNNSLVLKVEIDEFNYLFTGDIESEVEVDLILKYGNNLVSDVLKVAHHGSKTSSSLEFLNVVNPKYLLLSVGRGNIYNFPNNKDILNMHNVYRTDISNSITLCKRKKFFYVEK